MPEIGASTSCSLLEIEVFAESSGVEVSATHDTLGLIDDPPSNRLPTLWTGTTPSFDYSRSSHLISFR